MSMSPGILAAGAGLDGVQWNVLGQTYVPKQLSEQSFAWEAALPPGTFVPPHIHPTQDEFIYVLDGTLDLLLEDRKARAGPGDLVHLPMGRPHGIFSNGEKTAQCLFWVSPTRKLYELFTRITNLSDPAEVVKISAEHEVEFLPPPDAPPTA